MAQLYQMSLPTLRTKRLLLRPFTLADAPAVQALAGERDVASTTLTMPHPYESGMAETWISGHASAWESGQRLTLAIATTDDLVGAIGLHVVREHERAELGYWIGVPYWNRGYATEAASEVLAFGFTELGLHRIMARHFPRNPASGRVMAKIGMSYEGRLRDHVVRWGQFEDLECFAILEVDWRRQVASTRG